MENSFQIFGVMEGVYPSKRCVVQQEMLLGDGKKTADALVSKAIQGVYETSWGPLEVGDESNGKWNRSKREVKAIPQPACNCDRCDFLLSKIFLVFRARSVWFWRSGSTNWGWIQQ